MPIKSRNLRALVDRIQKLAPRFRITDLAAADVCHCQTCGYQRPKLSGRSFEVESLVGVGNKPYASNSNRPIVAYYLRDQRRCFLSCANRQSAYCHIGQIVAIEIRERIVTRRLKVICLNDLCRHNIPIATSEIVPWIEAGIPDQ